MAITSEIIGRLGGAGVEVIPVEGTASGSSGSSAVLATIDIPAGETWLVAAIGKVTAASNGPVYSPRLRLGDEASISASSGTHGIVTTATKTVSLSIVRNYAPGTDSFTGHVYTAKM